MRRLLHTTVRSALLAACLVASGIVVDSPARADVRLSRAGVEVPTDASTDELLPVGVVLGDIGLDGGEGGTTNPTCGGGATEPRQGYSEPPRIGPTDSIEASGTMECTGKVPMIEIRADLQHAFCTGSPSITDQAVDYCNSEEFLQCPRGCGWTTAGVDAASGEWVTSLSVHPIAPRQYRVGTRWRNNVRVRLYFAKPTAEMPNCRHYGSSYALECRYYAGPFTEYH